MGNSARYWLTAYGEQLRFMDPKDHQLELVKRAVAGNTVALTVLLTNLRDPLKARLTRKIPASFRSSVDAEDVIQEAQVEAFLHIRDFVPKEPGSFDRWFATIATRRLQNAIRRQRALKRSGDRLSVNQACNVSHESVVALLDMMAGPIKTPSSTAARNEAVRAVDEAIEQLPGDYQRAVRLVYLEGLTTAEAAERMQRTERAVHNLCYKAKKHLRDLLGSRSRYLSHG